MDDETVRGVIKEAHGEADKILLELIGLRDVAKELARVLSKARAEIEADHEHLMGDHEGAMDSPEIIDLLKEIDAALDAHKETTK